MDPNEGIWDRHRDDQCSAYTGGQGEQQLPLPVKWWKIQIHGPGSGVTDNQRRRHVLIHWTSDGVGRGVRVCWGSEVFPDSLWVFFQKAAQTSGWRN